MVPVRTTNIHHERERVIAKKAKINDVVTRNGDGVRSEHHSATRNEMVSPSQLMPRVTNLPPLPTRLLKSIPKVYQEKLVPLDLKFGVVRREEYTLEVKMAHQKALAKRQFLGRAKASICFLVKRPGCVICKEQGMMLKELVSSFPGDRVAAWAVIKEINVDNEGLLELYQNYFHFPFFLDKQMKLYKAMGKRYVNPFKFFSNVNKFARTRIEEKGIPGTFVGKGEGLILGGVLIFDSSGNIRYAYRENSEAQELPMEEIRRALNEILDRDGKDKSKRRQTTNASLLGEHE